jgi:hypothetical protein
MSKTKEEIKASYDTGELTLTAAVLALSFDHDMDFTQCIEILWPTVAEIAAAANRITEESYNLYSYETQHFLDELPEED